MANAPIRDSVRSPEAPAPTAETPRAESPGSTGGFWSIEVYRCDPEQSLQGLMVPYRVPRIEKMTILDALVYIQRHHDRSLAFRYACRLGMCGTCTVMVNVYRAGRAEPRSSVWGVRPSASRRCVSCRSSRMCWWTTNRSSPSIAPHNPTLCHAKNPPKRRRSPQPHASAGPLTRTSNVLPAALVTPPVRCWLMMQSTWGRRR